MDPLPVAAMRAILERYGRLLARSTDELGDRPLVLPTSEFFPDAFAKDQRSLTRLVRRMQKHAGMSDIPIVARLVGSDDTPAGGSCGTGGCGSGACATPDAEEAPPRLVDNGSEWRMNVPEAELRSSVALTANIARSLGYVFLIETRAEDEALDEPLDVTAELAAVALGFGVLLLEGSYMYSKSCGGPSVGRVTRLSCAELAVAFCAFVARGRHPLRSALRELGTTQRALVEQTQPWIAHNARLVAALQHDPSELGKVELEEPRPWLLRLFGKPSRTARTDIDSEIGLDELEAMVSAMPEPPKATSKIKRPDPRRDELRELVEEAMATARHDP